MQKNSPRIDLKKGKDRPILQRHHWIYSGAIANISPSLRAGDLVEVYASSGKKLGVALFNPGHSITAHMIAFGEEPFHEALKNRMMAAVALRQKWFDLNKTNAFRLINAEGDGIPGLIVDSYAGVLVVQISHAGLERVKDLLVSILVEVCHPIGICEKSTSSLRKKEGMQEIRSHLYGEKFQEIEILENGLKYLVDLEGGQKTGFFLDQREMRKMVSEISSGSRVLNCFAYTGGFSIAALSGGAVHVDSVEISAKCGPYVDKNILLNGLALDRHHFIASDVASFFKTCHWNYDVVILDPPAFVKKWEDVDAAFRAYKDMNYHAMMNMAPNSLLLTSSCSCHIEESLFQNILFRAALEAKRSIRIVGRHRMAIDHPISIFHPESAYLKSFLLAIE